MFLVKLLICILVADHLSGVFHWLEDAYGSKDWPLTGGLVTRPNVLHHHDAREFTRHTWLYSSWMLMALSGLALAVGFGLGLFDGTVCLAALLGANANEIRKSQCFF